MSGAPPDPRPTAPHEGPSAGPSVLHLLAPAPFGGMESVVTSLARGQLDAGQDVTVACLLPPGSGPHPFVDALGETGIPTRRIDVGGRDYAGERKAVARLLAELRSEVLHTHGYRPDVVDSGVARSAGVRTISTVHGFTMLGLRGRVYEWIQRRWLRRFDAVVVVSEPLRNQLQASGVPRERLHVIRNAWRPLRPPLGREEARGLLGIETDERVVGWVGRMSPEKGPDVMVEALARLGDRGVALSFIGTGPLDGELRSLARERGVEDRVRWHGMVPDAGRCLRAFDAVLLTSRTEGTPMVLLEAMAAEVPLVVTAVGGIPQVVSEAEAVLVPSPDPAAVARGLDLALHDEPASRERCQAARRRLDRDFAVEAWVDRYRDVYTPSP